MSPAKRKTAASAKAAKKKTAKKTAPKKTASRAASKAKQAVTSDFYDHNVEVARELAAIAKRSGVSELIYETDALTLTIRRGDGAGVPVTQVLGPAPVVHTTAPAMVTAPAPAAASPAAEAPAEDDDLHVVTSPFVGTFYRSPNPDSPSYAEAGQTVTKGQVLCIVEAMKLMNEIEADVAGTIKTILVKNAESVEYGQALFKIEPA